MRAPWVATEDVNADLFTPAIVPAHAAALALALVMERLENLPVRTGVCHGAIAGERVWPRSDGRAASADGEPVELSDAAAGDL